MPTVAEVTSWRGRDVIDPRGAMIGVLGAAFRDRDTGAAEWLGVETEDHPGEVTVVPVAGASPAGRAISVPYLAERARAALRVRAGDDVELGVDEERRVAEHYGLLYDTEHSGTGMPVEPELVHHGRPAPPVRSPEPALRRRVLAELSALHAVEAALVTQLGKLSLRMPDEEVAHDLRLHLGETERHAAAVQARLQELGARRSPAADARALLAGMLQGAVSAGRGDPALDVRDAYALEHLEIARYTTLARLAARAGDTRTATLARGHRADEQAMATTIAAGWTRLAALTEHDVPALLRAARAVERRMRRRLDARATARGDAALRAALQRHGEETDRHLRALDDRLGALDQAGGGRGDGAGGALVVALSRTQRGGGPVRTAYAAVVDEHLAIGTYELLERVALRAGDEASAALARANRADEEAMAATLGRAWDGLVDATLGASQGP